MNELMMRLSNWIMDDALPWLVLIVVIGWLLLLALDRVQGR